ncbi:anhydro-N-acetylmuramic acid kinase [Salinimicrobium catena]|uniref:anhydro-N-acetylmuramic acid kinase n=1 Tax=Salinimicrobium catena TaxID=390640 RepID=UPI002FE4C53B
MNENNYNVLGIMSGTSLDGIDIALLNFQKNETWDYKILTAETIPYPEEWQKKLSEALFYNDLRLHNFNEEYTSYLAEVIHGFIQKHEIKDIDSVCSHGHTIKHEPENGFTLQIGNLPKLAKMLGHKVVCDFRVQDVDLGGQGAPLVPIGDELLFSEYDYCLNLGGFANISTNRNGTRIAYDICAVNTVLNFLANKLNLAFDRDGEIAASGKIEQGLLEKLNSLPYYQQNPPKSLGIEWVNSNILPFFEDTASVASALRTYTVHAGTQIAKELKGDETTKVLVTGGGAFNGYLIREIAERTKVEVVIPSADLVNFKEALIFGFLGVLKLRGEVNVLSSVTGASKDHSSGVIFEP